MKKHLELEGIISAMVTPMHEDETVNEDELKRQVDRQIAAGVAAVFCLGTNGEFYALSRQEKERVILLTVAQAAGRVPVLAGTGCVTTKETIALTRFAKEAGADAASVVTPYFAGLDQAGVLRHFTAVAREGGIPVIIYNIPARTGVNITWQTVQKLAQEENIIGVKDSSGNFDNTLRYIEATPDGFIVLCGNDSLILWTLMAGGQGGIAGLTNLFPERMVSIYRHFKAGELAEARAVQDSVRPIRDTFALGNPNSIVKRAACLLGQNVGPARAPFNLDDPAVVQKIREALTHYSEYRQA